MRNVRAEEEVTWVEALMECSGKIPLWPGKVSYTSLFSMLSYGVLLPGFPDPSVLGGLGMSVLPL